MGRHLQGEEKMNIMNAYHLILRYPTLGNYIQESYNRGNDEELIDFLFALDTEPVLYYN
jgi:hypothetical protein